MFATSNPLPKNPKKFSKFFFVKCFWIPVQRSNILKLPSHTLAICRIFDQNTARHCVNDCHIKCLKAVLTVSSNVLIEYSTYNAIHCVLKPLTQRLAVFWSNIRHVASVCEGTLNRIVNCPILKCKYCWHASFFLCIKAMKFIFKINNTVK